MKHTLIEYCRLHVKIILGKLSGAAARTGRLKKKEKEI